jgi:hypothetical protein
MTGFLCDALVFVNGEGSGGGLPVGGFQDGVTERGDGSDNTKEAGRVIVGVLISESLGDIVDRSVDSSFPDHLFEALNLDTSLVDKVAEGFIAHHVISNISSRDIMRDQHPLTASLIDDLCADREVESLADLFHVVVGLEKIDTTAVGCTEDTKISGSDTTSREKDGN